LLINAVAHLNLEMDERCMLAKFEENCLISATMWFSQHKSKYFLYHLKSQ
jgi:hypothetical protein